MTRKLKRYCPACNSRISHSATRCPYCGKRIFTTRLVLRFIIIAVMIIAIAYLLVWRFTNP